jgi:asparagine synthase (glutamine-hydrolysing)
MLEKIAHRGPEGCAVIQVAGGTLGVVWTQAQADASIQLKQAPLVQDRVSDSHWAQAQATPKGLMLQRDQLGVAPLYYGWTEDGAFCFASEVKALLEVTREVHEVPPGHRHDGRRPKPYFHLAKQPPLAESPERLADGLRQRLAVSVQKRIGQDGEVGAWLSGGLDSSAMAALARPHVSRLHTFAAGLSGAPDLEYARAVAAHIQAEHHEFVINFEDMLAVLPDVIYHLESFDALLVRSSISNYLVAKMASDYVSAVFSGEGGDELFAGYAYLKSLQPETLPDELIDITARLHNTALQRVDRCASAHGTVAYVGFLDPEVVDYALHIPASFKLRDGVEKWILRRALHGLLPEAVLKRAKAKFWEGAGTGEMLAHYAQDHISDAEFKRERTLPNGWTLNTKEELLYYRVFREHFGDLADLSWMGRTKEV